MALEDYGVLDIFVSGGQIILITNGQPLNLPAWLQEEYINHREDLVRQLRRVRPLTFAIGVFT